MAEITITLSVDVGEIDRRLAAARRLVEALELARRLAAEIAGDRQVAAVAPRRAADDTPPQAVAATNGHAPKVPVQRAPTEKRARRQFTEEQKRAGAARAREVGATKAAEEFDVVPTVVRGWLKKHPKEHAVAEPIKGSGPKVGESRDEWESRMRAAAGAAL